MQTKITLEQPKKEFKPFTLNIQLTIEREHEWESFSATYMRADFESTINKLPISLFLGLFIKEVCKEVHNSYKP
jgi:hypothetical protein